MATPKVPAVVFTAALVLLVGSIVWTVAGAGSRGSRDSGYGGWMMGDRSRDDGEPVRDIGQAKAEAQRFADRLDLRVGEVIEFERNYYAVLEKPDGARATEVLVNPDTGSVALEYGPAMMWNTRYGMMGDHMGGGMMGGSGGMMDGGGTSGGGMMGGSGNVTGGTGMMGDPGRGGYTGERTVGPQEARQIANRWLRDNRKGLRAGEAEDFPGYYTLETFRGDRLAGMMSVNEFTGAVWYHTWHGRFRSIME